MGVRGGGAQARAQDVRVPERYALTASRRFDVFVR
jgi:hypothetical protein